MGNKKYDTKILKVFILIQICLSIDNNDRPSTPENQQTQPRNNSPGMKQRYISETLQPQNDDSEEIVEYNLILEGLNRNNLQNHNNGVRYNRNNNYRSIFAQGEMNESQT